MKLLSYFLFLLTFSLPSAALSLDDLPKDLNWQTGLQEPLFASKDAQFGGVFRTYISSFPQTFRTLGPDSNGTFAAWLRGTNLELLDKHPNTDKFLPSIAQSWALAGDDQSVYFKINPNARWSDGVPVTAKDFTFMLQLMRSKNIIAPWYNDFYTNEIKEIKVFDDLTIQVVSGKKRSEDELLDYVNLQPKPAHFYANPEKDEDNDGIADDYVRRYNFKIEPVTGPYFIDKIIKGKKVSFKHVGQDWWGYEIPYYQHRFNVAAISLRVIRDPDIAMRYFEKGYLDAYPLIRPVLWHEKAQGELYDKGYIQKAWGYNQAPVGAGGMWLNTAMPLLDDINIRTGLGYAIDYDGMLKDVLRGDYIRKPNPMGFGHGEYDNSEIKAPAFDPKLAIQWFEKSGFNQLDDQGVRTNAKGQRLSFVVTYATSAHTPRLAYLREKAKLAGVDLELNLIDGSSMFKFVLEKKHQISFHDMGTSSIPAYWEYFYSTNANKPQTNNFTNYSSPELDKLIDAFRSEFDSQKKRALSRQIQQQIDDAKVIISGFMVPYTRVGFWRYLKFPEQFMTKQTNYLFLGGGFMGSMSTFWIDQDEKEKTLQAKRDDVAFEPKIWLDETYKIKSEPDLTQMLDESEQEAAQ